MRVLFIGGTGNISAACTREASRRGIEVVHFNRGRTSAAAPGGPGATETITGDIRDAAAAGKLLAGREFDAVVDFIAFTPEHISQDIDLFRDSARQFIFISSASVYHKPPRHYIITESTPAYNPFWRYAQEKIACEELLQREYRAAGFPVTIVRPSHTYSDGWFPTAFKSTDFTIPQRMLDGKPVVVHGDGQSLWTITHSEDFARGFVGLLGNPSAIGETFHITSDEALPWEEIHRIIGATLGVEPRIVHAPSDMIARLSPDVGAGLLGDKQYSVVFDNSKIKRLVPGYQAVIPFHEGMRRSLAWVNQEPGRRESSGELNELIDDIVRAIEPMIRQESV